MRTKSFSDESKSPPNSIPKSIWGDPFNNNGHSIILTPYSVYRKIVWTKPSSISIPWFLYWSNLGLQKLIYIYIYIYINIYNNKSIWTTKERGASSPLPPGVLKLNIIIFPLVLSQGEPHCDSKGSTQVS